MHTLPLVGCLIHNCLVPHHYPKFSKGVTITVLAGLAYLTWVFYIAYASNKWVYGMLAVMDNVFRALFVLFQLTTLILSYKLGERINSTLWSPSQRAFKLD
jgi:hypothetical protein